MGLTVSKTLQRSHAMGIYTFENSDAMPHLVEETLVVVCPRNAREFHEADLFGKPPFVMGHVLPVDGGKRRRCRSDVDRAKVTALRYIGTSLTVSVLSDFGVTRVLTEREMP